MKLLIVDDSTLNLTLLSEFMKHIGHEVTCANGGLECLAALQVEKFDCILLDIQMPDIDGITVLQTVRSSADTQLANTPVIALTALAFPRDRNMCLDAGASLYISKPFSFRDLAGILEGINNPVLAND